MADWLRYRFQANIDDPRPVLWPPMAPWWCSGTGDDYSTVIAYIPKSGAPFDALMRYWPDACCIEEPQACEQIKFSERFPCPDWWDEKTESVKETHRTWPPKTA
jgi:hypothetical protein